MKPRPRLATIADAAELARLRWEYRREEAATDGRVGGFDDAARREFLGDGTEWLEAALASGRWLVAVAATDDGRLGGCLYLERVDKVPEPGRIARAWGYLTNAYVAAEFRGGGLGRALLDRVVDEARERGFEFVIVWPSEQAVPFYRRAGFRDAAEVHDRADDAAPMEMELGPD